MKKFLEHFWEIVCWVAFCVAVLSVVGITILAALGYDFENSVLKCLVYMGVISGGLFGISFLSIRRIVAALEEFDKQLAEEEKMEEPFEEFSNKPSKELPPQHENTIKQVSEETAKEIAYKFFGRNVNYDLINEYDGFHYDANFYHFKEGVVDLLIYSEYGGVSGENCPYGNISIGNGHEELSFEYIDGEIKAENPLRLQSDLAEILSELLLDAINIYEDDENCPKITDYEVVDEQPLYRALCLADEIKNRIPRKACKNCNKGKNEE